MEEDLTRRITELCGTGSRKVVNTLYKEGLLDNNSIRNYLIRKDFEQAIRQDNPELIKHIFIDLSDKYNISVRQAQRIVYDYMKKKMTESTEFRTLFEYCFPVKKLFNFLMINMDQSVSAFLTNTKIRGVKLDNPVVEEEGGGMRINRRQILNPSGIDPEQFKNAKGIAKTILENVLNSDNYRYIPAEAQEAGGITNLVLRNSLEDL